MHNVPLPLLVRYICYKYGLKTNFSKVQSVKVVN